MGIEPRGTEDDAKLVSLCEQAMRESRVQPDTFFYEHRGGRRATGELGEALANYRAVEDEHEYWEEGAPQSMLIDEMETIWSAIAERDDWSALEEKIALVRRMGAAHGEPPEPAGHLP